jgi:hypothetical protein
MAEYVHETPGTEIYSISGRYSIIEEGTMTHSGRVLLYRVGIATIDNACCGSGGCRFIHVSGYVKAWQHHVRPDGLPVSLVECVSGKHERKRIEALLHQQFPHSQVVFGES